MIHVLQSLRTGETEIADVPVPRASANSLVVESRASLISPGTERMLVEFGRAGWLEKARSQPDKVGQVLAKMRTEGVGATFDAVRAKLDAPISPGYCQAGVVREIGRNVKGFAPGDRVVTNGPHAEYVRVTQTLAARIPDSVSFEAAAFTPLAAIGLQGLRLAQPTLGETVVVYGLGAIGQLAVQLAIAAGCRVIGIDRSAERCELAENFGATSLRAGDERDLVSEVMQVTEGIGADIVLLTLASDSDEPISQAAKMSRKRGRVVLVGVTGLNLSRDDFYKKELSFQVSCSYGPGRYDPAHEEAGVDYPLPYVRWTEGRNFSAVLGLMAQRRLDPTPLISHRFSIADAAKAYSLIGSDTPSLGVVLTYEEKRAGETTRTLALAESPRAKSRGNVGFIGAGNYASRVLMPAFKEAGAGLEVVASSAGVSAATTAKQYGFSRVTSDAASVLSSTSIDTVVVATRHDSHAEWVVRGLEAGKNVFVEKPLALRLEDLQRIRVAASDSGRLLCVGFNRRFAPHVEQLKQAIVSRKGPGVLSITVNAGAIPPDHWTQDPEAGGGRIVGEACHFIDLARFLIGTPIRQLQVVAARSAEGRVLDDIALLQLSFADGSAASIQYLANGDKRFPKERVEAFFDGKTIRLDNFRTITAWGISGVASRLPRRADKGQLHFVKRFLDAIRLGGEPPIPIEELLEVSAFSIEAGRLSQIGGGTITATELESRQMVS